MNMENEIQTIKPNSPRWLDCDLNCNVCDYASDCVFETNLQDEHAFGF